MYIVLMSRAVIPLVFPLTTVLLPIVAPAVQIYDFETMFDVSADSQRQSTADRSKRIHHYL
jgi:hypothetical protein